MRTASASPARVASGTPLVVSWSVRAIAARPAACARRATSAGGYSPSDAVEWQCRSTRAVGTLRRALTRSEEHTSELQSLAYLVCRLLLEKKKKNNMNEQATQKIKE